MIPFGELAEFRNGLNFSRTGTFAPIKIIGVGDFGARSKLESFDGLSTIHPDRPTIPEDLLQDHDLLFVRSNGNKALIGRCMSIHPGSERITFSGFTIRARVTDERLNKRFAAHLFRSELFFRRLHEQGSGSNISNLNQGILSGFEVPVPPLEVQERISTFLETWDRAIGIAESCRDIRLRAHGTMVERAIFDELSPVVRLGDYAAQENVRPSILNDMPTVYSCTKSEGLVKSSEYFGRQVHSSDVSKYKFVAHNTFCYATNHIEEGSIGLMREPEGGVVSPMYTTFSVDVERANPHFVYALLKTERARIEFARRTEASVDRRGGLRWPDFCQLEFPLPCLERQAKIAKLSQDVLKEKLLMTDRVRLLRQQREALADRLFSGKLSAPMAARAA